MDNVPEFLKRASEKVGFRRERYVENNIPNVFSNLAVMCFYGDIRSEYVFSTLLLHKIKELHASKYFILCSYPGRAGLYPYVDEYWSFSDQAAVDSLRRNAVGFENKDVEKVLFQEQQLNKYFENVLSAEECFEYYRNGFRKEFFDKFKWVVYNLPSVPSPKVEFNRNLMQRPGYKVFIHPSKTLHAWSRGKEVVVNAKRDFWVELVNRLARSGFTPVVWQDGFDVSSDVEGCMYCTEGKVLDVLGVMRAVGCVLDVFSGVSGLAAASRTPFVSCYERHYYNGVKVYETDELCNGGLPHQYIFSFPTIIESGNWSELIDTIISRLDKFIPELNRDEWPSTAEQSEVLPYSAVKKRKSKRIGSRFIRVERL